MPDRRDSVPPRPDGWEFVCRAARAPEAGARAAPTTFSCVTLSVPVDHAQPAGEHWDVTFGAAPGAAATGSGVYVTATGGPGSSGLAVADAYAGGVPRRGPAAASTSSSSTSAGSGCPRSCAATTRYYAYSAYVDTSSSTARAGRLRRGEHRRFGADCFAEAGVDPADGAPLRHRPGGRGPRGPPAVAGRAGADPLRRELRHPVRAGLRRGAPRPGRRAGGGRRGGPSHRPAASSPSSRRRAASDVLAGHADPVRRRTDLRGRRAQATPWPTTTPCSRGWPPTR